MIDTTKRDAVKVLGGFVVVIALLGAGFASAKERSPREQAELLRLELRLRREAAELERRRQAEQRQIRENVRRKNEARRRKQEQDLRRLQEAQRKGRTG
jgi:hypothetical protein